MENNIKNPIVLLKDTLKQIDVSIDGIRERNRLFPNENNIETGNREIADLELKKIEYLTVLKALSL